MKRIFMLVMVVMAMACNQTPKEDAVETAEVVEIYGDTITEEGAIPTVELAALMADADSKELKLVGTIEECCQKKGCWMKVDLGDGKTMRVTFKDYGFFVPKDAAGRQVIMDGVATFEETSVEALKHYAEDAGKSKEEIAAITAPAKELVFEARGVILK
jgi:membrane-bound lytic murein transglycosylase